MAKRREEPKVEMVCEECGSTDVSRDAWGEWDVEAQDWMLRTVFDDAHCHRCDGRTTIEERPLKRRRKRTHRAHPQPPAS